MQLWLLSQQLDGFADPKPYGAAVEWKQAMEKELQLQVIHNEERKALLSH